MRLMSPPESNAPSSPWEYAYTWIGDALYRRLKCRRDPRINPMWDRAHPEDAAQLSGRWDPSKTHPPIAIEWIPCEDPLASSDGSDGSDAI